MNKRNQIIIASSVGVVLLLGGLAWFLLKPKPADSTPPDSAGAPVAMNGQRRGGPGMAGGQRPGGGPRPAGNFGRRGNPGRPAPASPVGGATGGVFANAPAGGSPAGAQAAAAPGAPAMRRQPGFDPFYVTWHTTPPPPYVFDAVEPVRVASDEVETPASKPFEIREEPALRVSGIMSGDGVYAILEKPDGVDIVKPGSTVEIAVGNGAKRTYRVVSIQGNTVKLQSREGNATFTQVVPLSDAPLNTKPAFYQQGQGAPGVGRGRGGGGGLDARGAPVD